MCSQRLLEFFFLFILSTFAWSQKRVYGDTLEVQLRCILSDGGFGSDTIRHPHVGDLDGEHI